METARSEMWHCRTGLMGREGPRSGRGYLKEGWDAKSQALVIWLEIRGWLWIEKAWRPGNC